MRGVQGRGQGVTRSTLLFLLSEFDPPNPWTRCHTQGSVQGGEAAALVGNDAVQGSDLVAGKYEGEAGG